MGFRDCPSSQFRELEAVGGARVARVTDPRPYLPVDPFVKVYLLQDGRKMSKKKTAVKRDDPNPVFNEAMIFSVPAIVLQVRWAGTGLCTGLGHCTPSVLPLETSSQPPSS